MARHIGTENLKPMNTRTKAEQKEIATMGGKASGVTRQKNKTFKEAIQWYLDMDFDPQTDREKAIVEKFPKLTNRDAVAISMLEASVNTKDVRASVFLRDTVGEMPTQNVAVEQSKPFEINIKTIE